MIKLFKKILNSNYENDVYISNKLDLCMTLLKEKKNSQALNILNELLAKTDNKVIYDKILETRRILFGLE